MNFSFQDLKRSFRFSCFQVFYTEYLKTIESIFDWILCDLIIDSARYGQYKKISIIVYPLSKHSTAHDNREKTKDWKIKNQILPLLIISTKNDE
jgi:hypothetical protein